MKHARLLTLRLGRYDRCALRVARMGVVNREEEDDGRGGWGG